MVGSYLILDLLRSGQKVRALKRCDSDTGNIRKIFGYYSDTPDELFSRIEWVESDILDLHSIEDAVKGAQHVYHTAGIVSFDSSDADEIMQVNVEGTANIVDASLSCNVKKICFISSIAALGISEQGEKITENTRWKYSKDESAYSISKYYAELEVWRGVACGLDSVIVNPSIILGAGNRSSGSYQLFSRILNGFRYYTNGVTGFVDVRDVSMAMIRLMESEIRNEKYILSSEDKSFLEIFEMIASSLGKDRRKIYIHPVLTEIFWRIESIRSVLTGSNPVITKSTAGSLHKKLYYSNSKVTERLGMEFIPVKDTIGHLAELFRKERAID